MYAISHRTGALTPMNCSRKEIAANVGFSTIIDPKFKTASLTLRFITKLDSRTAAPNSLGVGTLSASNSRLTTLARLNERLSSLYGAALSTFTRKRGDVQILGLTASWITRRYAFDGENVDSEMLAIIRDCLFAPNVKDGEFDAESFAITKKDLLDRIDSELNNKRGYALSRAAEIAFRGEPAEFSCYGTKEAAAAVTSAEAYEAYKELIRTSRIEIFYIAPEENPEAEEMLRSCISELDRQPQDCVFRSKSPVREKVEEVSDKFDVLQCKMVMNFKSDSDDMAAMKLLSTIFGETPVSKLFMNVREKLSLCYYCACRTVASKGALMVDIGVEHANIDKARDEILRQLDEIRNGNITDEELQSAMMSLDNALTQIGDTPSSYSGWYFERLCDGKMVTPMEQLELYKNVTKERIIEAAGTLTLDSVYLMLSKEADK